MPTCILFQGRSANQSYTQLHDHPRRYHDVCQCHILCCANNYNALCHNFLQCKINALLFACCQMLIYSSVPISSQTGPRVFALGYSLCFGTVLAKTWRIYYIFAHPTLVKKKASAAYVITFLYHCINPMQDSFVTEVLKPLTSLHRGVIAVDTCIITLTKINKLLTLNRHNTQWH